MMARLLPRFLAAAGIVAAALLLPGLAHAQAAGTEEAPVLLRADSMSYDRELGVVTASGHVEVSRDNQVLLTDHLVYNQRDDILTATGNVSLLEGEGDVFFASRTESSAISASSSPTAPASPRTVASGRMASSMR
jgi:LPS-assembly protein